MFETIRKHNKIIQVVLFILIVPSFILLGIDGYTRMSDVGTVLAQAPGYKITDQQFENLVKQEVDQILLQQPNLEAKTIDTPEFRKRILDRALNEAVMNHAAKVQFVHVSESRLAKALLESPEIAALKGPDGKIDMERYKQLAGAQGLTTDAFEKRVAENLAMRQGFEPLSQSAFVAQASAERFTKTFFDKREVQTYLLKPETFVAQIKPTDSEVEAFFKKNSAKYSTPETVDVEYVVLDASKLAAKSAPTPAQIEAYYKANQAQFSGSEERRSRHILIAVKEGSSVAEKEAAKKKAQDVLQKVKANPADFGKLAKQYSDDPGSKVQGGDLGYVAQNGSFVKPFEDALFALKKGDVTDLVESQFGYHIIQLTDIKPAQAKPLSEVQSQIVQALQEESAQKAFADASENFSNMVYEQDNSFKAVAEKLGLEVKTVTKLSKLGLGASADPLVSNPKFIEAAFAPAAIKDKRNSAAIDLGSNVLVSLRVLAHQPKQAQTFAQVKEQVRAEYIQDKSVQMAKAEGERLLSEWKKSPESAKGLSAAVQVSRDNAAGLPPKVVEAVLRLPVGKEASFAGVDLEREGYVLIKHLRQIEASPPAEQTSAIGQQLLQARQAAEILAYLERTKRHFKVKIYRTNLMPAK